MALIAWFPLNGNLNNNGINQSITLTNSGAVVDSSGKTGSCYSFTESQCITANNLPYSKLTNCSICFWIYIASAESWLPFAGQSTSYYILATENGTGNFYHSNIGSNTLKIYCDGVIRANPNTYGMWHHYCITGVNLSSWTTFKINSYPNYLSWNFTGKMNDLRIYDHVLSKQEVHEISQALALHYPLNDQYVEATTNIVPNSNTFSDWGSYSHGYTSISDSEFGGKKVIITNCVSWCGIYKGITLPQAGTYTLSVWCKPISRSSTSVNQTLYSSGGGLGDTCVNASWIKPNTWQKLTMTLTYTSTSIILYLIAFGGSSTTDTVSCEYALPQIEFKSYATPYVNGSRTPTTVFDCSGLKRNGTIDGTLTINTSTKRYDCSTQVLDTGRIIYPFPQLQEFTYSYWIKRNRTSYSNREMIGTGWYGVSMELNPNNTLTFRHQLTSGTFDVVSNTTFTSTTAWYHIVLTRNASGVSSIYVNGALDKSGTNANLINYTSSTAELFTYSGFSYQFRGSISDYRIYATALSANDILDLYNCAGNIDKTGKSHFYMNSEDSANVTVSKSGTLRGGDF